MKKLILFILLIPCICFADTNPYILGSGVESGGSDCLTGTYMGAWDGLYPADTDKMCVNSGASNKDGTQSGGTLSSGSYVVTDKDQYVAWANSANDIFDEDEGTLWIEINFDVGNSSNISFTEIYYDESNKMVLSYIDASDSIAATRAGGGASDSQQSTTGSVTKGATITVGMSWSVGRATADFAVTIDKGSNWDEVNDGIVTMVNAPTVVRMGNLQQSTSSGQGYTITKYAIQAGWETTSPW